MSISQKIAESHSEPLIGILKSQVIPSWEHYGMERLAVTANSLKRFHDQGVPQEIKTSVKQRTGKKTAPYSRKLFNNANILVEKWPDDDQAIFRYPALVFVLSGQASFHVADYLINCPAGHFLAFAKSVPRPIGENYPPLNQGEQCDVLWFFAPPGTGGMVAYICRRNAEKHWHDSYRVVFRPEAVQLFNFLMGELEEHAAHHTQIIQPGLQTFLHLFLSELQEDRYHSIGKGETRNIDRRIESPIEQAQEYIKLHLNKPLTAALVASQVYMSRTLFLQSFASETGETFHTYLTRQRMETAKELLNKGYWATAFICESIGLRPTQFRNQFKQYYGVTPTQYRNELPKVNDIVQR